MAGRQVNLRSDQRGFKSTLRRHVIDSSTISRALCDRRSADKLLCQAMLAPRFALQYHQRLPPEESELSSRSVQPLPLPAHRSLLAVETHHRCSHRFHVCLPHHHAALGAQSAFCLSLTRVCAFSPHNCHTTTNAECWPTIPWNIHASACDLPLPPRAASTDMSEVC